MRTDRTGKTTGATASRRRLAAAALCIAMLAGLLLPGCSGDNSKGESAAADAYQSAFGESAAQGDSGDDTAGGAAGAGGTAGAGGAAGAIGANGSIGGANGRLVSASAMPVGMDMDWSALPNGDWANLSSSHACAAERTGREWLHDNGTYTAVDLVVGLRDGAMQDALNGKLVEWKEAFSKKAVPSEWQFDLDAMGYRDDTKVSCQQTYNANEVVSQVLRKTFQPKTAADGSGMMYGEAMSMELLADLKCITYDIATGEPIGLAQVFVDGTDFKAVVDDAVRIRLKGSEAVLSRDRDVELKWKALQERFSGIRRDQPFYLTQDGITLVFDEGNPELGLADGPTEMPLPWSLFEGRLAIFDRYDVEDPFRIADADRLMRIPYAEGVETVMRQEQTTVAGIPFKVDVQVPVGLSDAVQAKIAAWTGAACAEPIVKQALEGRTDEERAKLNGTFTVLVDSIGNGYVSFSRSMDLMMMTEGIAPVVTPFEPAGWSGDRASGLWHPIRINVGSDGEVLEDDTSWRDLHKEDIVTLRIDTGEVVHPTDLPDAARIRGLLGRLLAATRDRMRQSSENPSEPEVLSPEEDTELPGVGNDAKTAGELTDEDIEALLDEYMSRSAVGLSSGVLVLQIPPDVGRTIGIAAGSAGASSSSVGPSSGSAGQSTGSAGESAGSSGAASDPQPEGALFTGSMMQINTEFGTVGDRAVDVPPANELMSWWWMTAADLPVMADLGRILDEMTADAAGAPNVANDCAATAQSCIDSHPDAIAKLRDMGDPARTGLIRLWESDDRTLRGRVAGLLLQTVFSCNAMFSDSPDGKWRIETDGLSPELETSGIVPAAEVRLVETATNQNPWKLPLGTLLAGAVWSPDSRYAALSWMVRVEGGTRILDTKWASSLEVPTLEAFREAASAAGATPTTGPRDYRPDVYVSADDWSTPTTVHLNFKWTGEGDESWAGECLYDVENRRILEPETRMETGG